MIRLLIGSALPLLGLGVAGAFLGPDLVTGPRGEPLVMAAPAEATLQPATFDGSTCPSTTLFADPSDQAHSGTRIVAFALRAGTDDVAIAVEDFPSGAGGTHQTVVLVFDEEGRLVTAGDPASLQIDGAASLGDCIGAPQHPVHGPV